MKKKILTFVLAICMIIPCALMVSACDKGADAKVMNVELNPKIEFVLDQNDKVLSVNALNEDGNHIISVSLNADTEVSGFEGLTADEAVELFLELTKENGYLITGNEEEIKIEVSGDADALLKKVKNKANEFFTQNGIDVEIVTGALKKAQILNEVKASVKEYSESELKAMTEAQLIDLLKKSREETKNLLTQELKEAYYNMRLEKINIAEMESLLNLIERIGGQVSDSLNQFKTSMETLMSKVEALEAAYYEQFLVSDSAYNIAKQAYIDAKENLLAQRLALATEGFTEEERAILANLEAAVAAAEAAWENAKVAAELAIESARVAVVTTMNSVKGMVASVKAMLELNPLIDLDTLAGAKENMKNDFKKYFADHDHFKDFVGHGHWQKAA